MKRIIRDRRLTPEEAAKYKAVREQIAQELPELVARHHERMAMLSLVAACCLCLPSTVEAQEKAKADKQDLEAQKVAEEFMKRVWKQDLERVVELVDVPFYWDGRENIEDRDLLRRQLARLLKRDRSEVRFKTKAIYAFGKLPKDFFRDQQRDLLTKILEETDRVVIFELSKTDDTPCIMVRIRAGKPKVVGFDG